MFAQDHVGQEEDQPRGPCLDCTRPGLVGGDVASISEHVCPLVEHLVTGVRRTSLTIIVSGQRVEYSFPRPVGHLARPSFELGPRCPLPRVGASTSALEANPLELPPGSPLFAASSASASCVP